MSIFTEFSNQYGQGATNGLDMSGTDTQTIVHDGSTGTHTVISHLPNGLGGENTYYDGKLVHSHQPNGLGGEMVTDAGGHVLRSSVSGDVPFDGNDYSSTVPAPMDMSNASQILNYDDPLSHSGSYIMPAFNPLDYQ